MLKCYPLEQASGLPGYGMENMSASVPILCWVGICLTKTGHVLGFLSCPRVPERQSCPERKIEPGKQDRGYGGLEAGGGVGEAALGATRAVFGTKGQRVGSVRLVVMPQALSCLLALPGLWNNVREEPIRLTF